ncbi:MAG: fatty acid desaturase, partial [Saprospiraceae bacterium]|nr:fatty acid desaturase [Saprospiraceae bacterium]
GVVFGLLYTLESIWLRIPLSIIAGLTLVRMFVIYHDYLHKTILQKSTVAKAWFYFFGLYILAPFSIWKRSHDYHHKHNSKLYTSSIGSFPIVTTEKFLSASKGERRIYLFIRHPLAIASGYFVAFLFGMCFRSFTASPKRHWDSLLSVVLHFGIGALAWTFGGFATFFLAFLLPSIIASATGSYLFYAQHNFPGVTFADKDGWTYINAALQSSSYMRMNPIMHWFTANIGYHHIHHVNARIPFYRLPEVFTQIEELSSPKETSLGLKEIWRCLQLKVWDPTNGKMLTSRELAAVR